jgi:sporulation protein YlmC with PRC-barrel domain
MAEAHPRILTTACELELMEVRTEDGRRLGRVFDLSLHTGRRGAPAVAAIVYGRRGLLERLGLRHARPSSLPWSRVRAIRDRVIVVDEAVRPDVKRL